MQLTSPLYKPISKDNRTECLTETFGLENAMRHPVHDIPYRLLACEEHEKGHESEYQICIEIPAGTLEKWTTDAETGRLYHETKNGQPRVWDFLPYPFNYGYIPQTYCNPETCGDGDPVDVCLLSQALERGSVQRVRIIGGMEVFQTDAYETVLDVKLLATLEGGPFSQVETITDLEACCPNVLNVLQYWIEGYKGPSKMKCARFLSRRDATELIEKAHRDWQTLTGKP
jgi:inorganic pyrophosphatase